MSVNLKDWSRKMISAALKRPREKNPREKKYVRIFENAGNQRKTMEVEKRGT